MATSTSPIPVFGGQPCLALAVPCAVLNKSTKEISEVGFKKSPTTIDNESLLANPGHVQISAPALPDPEQPTREAVHAAEAFLKSMLSNRATHPETYVQKIASRVGISPPALDRARASLGVTCQNESLALPKTKPGGRPRSPSMVVAHARDPRGMGQRKARASADTGVLRSAP